MATDRSYACPVCSEPYAEPPADCFRCETPLGAWWPFEEAAARSGPAMPPAGSRRRPAGPLFLAAVLGAVLAAGTKGLWSPAPAPPPAPAVALPAPVARPAPAMAGAPPVLRYRVQRGDTLWRIAAAVTGDGRNWRSLWPARDGRLPLTVGTVLEVPAAPSPAAR